jgi:hypothetical protein
MAGRQPAQAVDPDTYRDAVLDHARVMGIDPVKDADYLWSSNSIIMIVATIVL